MLIRRFYDDRLAQASYLVGCQETGDAIIIDPSRDAATYVAALAAEKMRLLYVTETHIHADYLSGTRDLARATRARPVLSDEGGEGWRYGWAQDAGALLVKDGATLQVGNIKVEVLHTPGHTPEHICFRITDGKATSRPIGIFTGDFIFVGDVGRPDLLERAAGHAGTMEAAARTLYGSIQRFKPMPDYLQLWPGHGAGSACGKALGSVPSTTLGYERFANWAFTAATEDDFVRMVLEGQPEPPAYFAVMKRLNRDGPPPRPATRPPQVSIDELRRLLAKGAIVVDARKTAEFGKGYLPGSYNVPLGSSFPTYAGSVVPYDRPIRLVVREELLDDALKALSSVGLDNVAGWASPEGITGGAAAPVIEPADAERLAAQGKVVIVDVRKRSEWDEGHIAGALHVPLAELQQRMGEIPEGKPLVIHCESGGRSSVAASVLRARGRPDVSNLKGGIVAWEKSGLPIESETLAKTGGEA